MLVLHMMNKCVLGVGGGGQGEEERGGVCAMKRD